MSVKRGIYLVANLRSEILCENLIYSIRQSGCLLPIRLIHFGGAPVQSPYILDNVEFLQPTAFSEQALAFVNNLQTVLTDCPRGFLYRFLAWFGDWDEFIYADNDIVALCNWEVLFEHLAGHDLVHADEEYITEGKYNYLKPQAVKELFGQDALSSAITAGHFAARRNEGMIKSINDAVDWFTQNPSIPKKHDQALLHVASLLGQWKMVNLCKPPYNWLSSWAGDYKNSLAIIHQLQNYQDKRSISHLHYSGSQPTGTRPIEDLLFAYANSKARLQNITVNGLKELSGLTYIITKKKKLFKKVRSVIANNR